jgi:hypothetical protein
MEQVHPMSMFTGGLDSRMPNYQTTILDDDGCPRWWRDSHNFNYRKRNNIHHLDDYGWTTLWPASSMLSGDPSAPLTLTGQDGSMSGVYNAWEFMGRGNGATKFIVGQCRDVSGNGVSGAVVQGFLTATDAYVGETQADGFGNYQLGTVYPSVNHYLVAYRAGAPDIAGTTVNTLQPTNSNGT